MNGIYVRGTKTGKVTSLRAEGRTVLTTNGVGLAEPYVSQDGKRKVFVADTKTGAILRTVASVQRVAPERYERQSRLILHFTDGTQSQRYAPSQTWMTVTV